MASQSAPRNPLLPLALLFTIGALWGFFFILIKTGVTGGVAPVSYLFWFSLIAGTIVFCIGCARREVPRFERRHLTYYLKASVARFTFANLILYTAQGKLPIGLMAVIMATTPIITYLLSLVFRVERLIAVKIVGVVLGICGAMMIVLPKSSLPDRSLAIWVLIGFCVPLMHGAAYVLLSEKHRPEGSTSLGIGAGTLFVTAILSLVLALAAGQFQILWPPFSTGELALMLHATLAGFNFYAMFELIRIAGPTFMSQSSSLAVGFGVLFGYLILGETLSLWVWGAIVLILCGVGLVSIRQKAG
jgi:drug/metabolite transporter (DMT)-like permease